jgi:hypothetical protein
VLGPRHAATDPGPNPETPNFAALAARWPAATLDPAAPCSLSIAVRGRREISSRYEPVPGWSRQAVAPPRRGPGSWSQLKDG